MLLQVQEVQVGVLQHSWNTGKCRARNEGAGDSQAEKLMMTFRVLCFNPDGTRGGVGLAVQGLVYFFLPWQNAISGHLSFFLTPSTL